MKRTLTRRIKKRKDEHFLKELRKKGICLNALYKSIVDKIDTIIKT